MHEFLKYASEFNTIFLMQVMEMLMVFQCIIMETRIIKFGLSNRRRQT